MSSYFYFDSSAWVKLYFHEPGSEVVTEIFNNVPRQRCLASALGHVEVAAVLAKSQRPKHLTDHDQEKLNNLLDGDWDRFTKLILDDHAFQEALAVARKFRLRGADAIHLATALIVDRLISNRRNRLVILTADHELLAASLQAGLGAQDPSADVLRPM